MSEDAFSWLTSDQIYTHKRKGGVSNLEILALPDNLRKVVNQVLRREPVRLSDLIAALDRPADDVRGELALLTAQGWLQAEEIEGETHYRVRLARRRARSLPPGIWQVLEGTWKMQLFRHFSRDEKADFTRAFELAHWEAGQSLFNEGEWGRTMYLIDTGQVELVTHDVDGREVTLARLKPGDIIGEVAVLLGERRSATARAVEPVSVWTLHKDDLDRLLARSPSAGLAIQREIERQVRGIDQPPGAKPAQERPNPILIVGPAAMTLVQALSDYTGERLLVLDLHATPLPSPQSPTAGSDKFPREDSELLPHSHAFQPPSRPIIEQQAAHHLKSKALAAAVRQGLEEFERVIIAAPVELHSPLMGVIGLIELVIDLSDTEVPWVIAAARRRWTVPSSDPRDIECTARRLCQRVVGLVLSGGAARTLAHIGVLRALEEGQIPIDIIASTGLGAVIAGLYAAGYSVDELTDLVTRRERALDPFDGSFNLRLISRSALYAGKRARNTLNKLVEGRTFEDLWLPLYIVAADLESGQPVIFDRGPLIDALEASVALAGMVAPAEVTSDSTVVPSRTRLLVDGGLINPMPADVLVQRGAGLVVGVSTIPQPPVQPSQPTQAHTSLSSPPPQPDLIHTWQRLRDQLAYNALLQSLRHLDLLITPEIDQFDGTAFDRAGELIAAGLSVTQKEIEHIQALLRPEID